MAVNQLARTDAEEGRAVRFDPDRRSFEAFRLGSPELPGTSLRDPLEATSLNEALAETTSRWAWDRGARLGVREIGERIDLLHIYAARRKSTPNYVVRDHCQVTEHGRWLDHICTVDLNVVAGFPGGLVSAEIELHERRQRQRPAGARLAVTR